MISPKGPTVAQEALDLMKKNGVPATTANYEVWLSYRLGNNQQLRQVIDARIAGNEAFTQEFNDDLYERFFTGMRASAQMVLAGERIARDLTNVLALMKTTEEKSGDYGRALETAASDLDMRLDQEQMRKVVASLAAATLDMATHNRQLTEQLHRSSREIETLRSSLDSVRVESLTDSLTGLHNRRMFDETLRMRITEARGQRTELCLMMCDIDHFKRFNDTWGHHTGDQILRFIASSLRKYALPDHLPARYGGEEFGMIMPRSTLKSAQESAELLRNAIQTKRLRRRSTNEDLGQVTISVGIARLQPGDTPLGLLERADACLYASKRNGRNQVTTDSTPVLYVA